MRSQKSFPWLPGQDSNLNKRNQNPLCYHYTTGQEGRCKLHSRRGR